jgi:nitrogen permease regulator 3-like protein
MPTSAFPLPPNPCLIAILLVTRSKSGSKLVYHYPPHPSVSSTSSARASTWYGTPATDSLLSDSSDSDGDTESDSGLADEDGASSRAGSRSSGGRGSSRRDNRSSLRGSKTKSGGPIGSSEDVDEDMPERTRDREGRLLRHRRQNDAHHAPNDKGEYKPDWEHVLGFNSGALSKLLSPGRSFNKRRFELGINQLVFLGAPRFVRDDGLWKKKRRSRRKETSEVPHEENVGNGNGVLPEESVSAHASETPTPTDDPSKSDLDLQNVPIFDAAYGHGLMSGAASEVGSGTRSASSTNGADDALGMFNVVFVLKPPALEYQQRVEEMYDNVAKRFAKALKYAQAYNNYVYLESRAISAMKEKAKEHQSPLSTLWASIAGNSSLARAIEITYRQISHDKIAHINLGELDTSIQIPRITSTRFAPHPTEPQMPGLWLTTATPRDVEDSETIISQNSALLLLEDDDVLLKEVEMDAKELSGPLSYFLNNLKPTKSLKKIAQMSSLSIKDVQILSRHLIYWRRARAIPPLRPQDIYIVSPNADMRKLKSDSAQYAAKFRSLPSLPKMLQSLSVPRPYNLGRIPTKDHRDAYMEILAWLMRHGWVTQLRTFGWIQVGPEIKASVAIKVEQERRLHQNTRDWSIVSGSSPRARSSDVLTSPDHHQQHRGSSASPLRLSDSTQPSISSSASPLLLSSTGATLTAGGSDTASIGSGRTPGATGPSSSERPGGAPPFSPLSRPTNGSALFRPTPLSIRHSPLQEIVRTVSPKHPDSASVSPTLSSAKPLGLSTVMDSPIDRPASSIVSAVGNVSNFSLSVITNPQRATEEESLWIERIEELLGDDELRTFWPTLIKYFDGNHSFEDISVREGLKKKKVQGMISKLVSDGWIVTVRHW